MDGLTPLFNGAYAGRRVLVTGATGFKGSWLCAWLRAMGATVRGISIDLPGTPAHFTAIGLDRDIEDIRADVRDAAATRRLITEFQPEFVFHLAAQALVRRSYADPITTFATNVLGPVHVLDAVRNSASVKAVVIITSDKCYENIEQSAGYHEDDRVGGKDPYSASKGAAEIVFSSYARSFFGAPNRRLGEQPAAGQRPPFLASARAGNVIGGGDWAEDRIVPDCVRAWLGGRPPVIRSPQATRPWQHVLEPLSGYLWLGARLAAGEVALHGDSFNFGPRAEVDETVIRLIDALRRHWPEAVAPEVHAPPPGLHEAGLLRLDCTKAEKILAWRATLEFAETARFTAAWFRAYAADPAAARRTTQAQIEEYVSLAQQRGLAWASPAKETTGR
jgi:CDP-glucose 4,6-dehydratase